MGIGAITTKECVKLARMGEKLGAQALTILPPMFLTPSDDELYRHFRTVAEATPLPLLLYNNPDRVGNNISLSVARAAGDGSEHCRDEGQRRRPDTDRGVY